MKRLNKVILPVLIVGISFACKKEPKSQVFLTGSQTSYDGFFELQKSTSLLADTVYYRTAQTYVSYYDSTINVNHSGWVRGVDVGQVAINGIILRDNYNSYVNSYDYYDSTNTAYSSPITVNISGGNSFGVGSFTTNEDYPVFSGYKYLPDTIYYSFDNYNNNIVIPISGYSGCDQVYAAITANPGIGPFTGSYPLEPGKQYALIPAHDLMTSQFGTGAAYLQIGLSKTRYVKSGGKNYLFTFSHNYYRNVILAPH